jgi:hypothetical protein
VVSSYSIELVLEFHAFYLSVWLIDMGVLYVYCSLHSDTEAAHGS